jgi:hypothetical protein
MTQQQQTSVRRAGPLRRLAVAFGIVLGLYLVGRAIVEPFVTDLGDPSAYRNDWGGPSLVGVLAVHCGPGIVAAVWMVIAVVRHRR